MSVFWEFILVLGGTVGLIATSPTASAGANQSQNCPKAPVQSYTNQAKQEKMLCGYFHLPEDCNWKPPASPARCTAAQNASKPGAAKPKVAVLPSDPGKEKYGRVVIVKDGVASKALLTYPGEKLYSSVSEISSTTLAVARKYGNGADKAKLAENAWTALVDARQGFYGAHQEYDFLRSENPESVALADHYLQAYSIGVGGHVFSWPQALITASALDPVYNLAKFVLQTGKPGGINFFATGSAKQSPANFEFWPLAGAADAIYGRPDTEKSN